MKKGLKNWTRVCIVAGFAAGSALLLSSCDKDKNDNNNNVPTYTVSGNASGSQEVPAVTGTGTGTFSGKYDPSTGRLMYTSTYTGLSGAPTSAAFYTGASGVSGTMTGNAWNLGTGLSATGSVTDTITLTQDQASQLLSGNLYYSYATTMNPGGEIRGQLSTTRD